MRSSFAVIALVLLAMSAATMAAKPRLVDLDTNQTRVCFDTVLTATANQVVANQGHLTCPPLWKLNTRHVFASQLSSDGTRLMMISTYPYASGTTAGVGSGSVNVFETYLIATGALVSSIELKDAVLPSLSSTDSAVSFCVTSQDVFLSTQGNGTHSRLQHYDTKTGVKKSMVAYDFITRSDRLWLACTDSALYVSVPMANAVWQLSPRDGLLERIVTRLPSPAALSIDSGFLRVVMGRPALRVLTFDLATGTHRDNVNVANNGPLNLRSITFAPSLAAVLIVTLDDSQTVRVLTDPLSNTVSAATQLAVNRAQVLLADGKSVIVNGLPVSYKTGVTLTGVADSALLNDGNAEQLAAVAYTTAEHKLLIIDTHGGITRFSSFDGDCAILFDAALPALLTENSRVLHTDVDSHNIMSLLYLASDGSTVVLRDDINDRQEHVWPGFCPDPNEQIIAGLATAWPEPRVCVMCSAEIICLDMQTQQRFAFYLPVHMINNLEQVRLEWSEDHTLAILFYAGTEVWILDGSIGSDGFVMVRRFDELPAVLDVHYWGVVSAYKDLYTLRISSTQLMVVSAENWTVISAPALDHKQALGATVMLVPNLGTPLYTADSLCIGFRGNQTTEPKDQLTQEQVSATIGIAAICAVLLCVSCTAGLGFCAFGLCRKSTYVLPCCSKKRDKITGFGEIGGASRKKRSAGCLRDVACGGASQNACFGLLFCCPTFASRVNAVQQSLRYPAMSEIDMTEHLANDTEGDDDDESSFGHLGGNRQGSASAALSRIGDDSFGDPASPAPTLSPELLGPVSAAAAAAAPPSPALVGSGLLDGFEEAN